MQMHQQPPFDLAISGVAQACAVRQCYSLHFGQLFTAHTGWLGLIYKAENAAQPMGYELQCTTQAQAQCAQQGNHQTPWRVCCVRLECSTDSGVASTKTAKLPTVVAHHTVRRDDNPAACTASAQALQPQGTSAVLRLQRRHNHSSLHKSSNKFRPQINPGRSPKGVQHRSAAHTVNHATVARDPKLQP
jgi:hypothetical protein